MPREAPVTIAICLSRVFSICQSGLPVKADCNI
jgi:hypothetical protein